MPYRLIYLGLAAVVVAVVAVAIAFSPTGDPLQLPGPIESVFPLPGDSVIRQTTVELDLEFGYEAEIFVDGFRLPGPEVIFVEATGMYRWAPSAAGVYLNEWTPGEHTVDVIWHRVVGTAGTGQYTWTFRVQ